MKIILSPSKTQASPKAHKVLPERDLFNEKKTLRFYSTLRKMPKDDLSKAMHLSGKLLDEIHGLYQTFRPGTSERIPAIYRYTGLVFRQLQLDDYNQEQWTYIDEHVRILSAMYGVVHPFSRIWMYRLDYTMRLPSLDLKKIWSKSILEAFKHEDLIIDLASHEFGSALTSFKKNRHQVIFLESIDDQEKIISANAKKARGLMLDFLIRNRVIELSGLRTFEEDGYRYQPERSNDKVSIFIKKQ